MGTKSDRFEESTKIHSSSELDEMLQKVRAKPTLNEDDYDNFEEHTIIGPAQELAAKSMTIPEEPAPIAARASTKNIVRRTGPVQIARSSDIIPAVQAQGSHAEMTAPAAPNDDDAFAAWSEFEAPSETPMIDTPMPMEALLPARASEPVATTTLPTAPSMLRDGIEMPAPTIIEPPAMRTQPTVGFIATAGETAAPATQRRWGAVAWVVLLVVMIGAGAFAYQRITELEEELAMTKSALEAAKVR